MKKIPVIGVTPLWDAALESTWMLTEYLEGIKAAGGLPVVLPFGIGPDEIARIVEMCDGFLFTGGQDVAPSVYGAEDLTGGTVKPAPCRDTLESALLPAVLEADKPVFGICRGLQFINAALGGTLWQDLPSEHPSEIVHRQGKPYDFPAHPVVLYGPLKALLGKVTIPVNTLHHQAVRLLAPSLKPMAITPDGLTEAVYMPGKRFVWAVQWHPEFLYKKDPDSLSLFRAFVDACL